MLLLVTTSSLRKAVIYRRTPAVESLMMRVSSATSDGDAVSEADAQAAAAGTGALLR